MIDDRFVCFRCFSYHPPTPSCRRWQQGEWLRGFANTFHNGRHCHSSQCQYPHLLVSACSPAEQQPTLIVQPDNSRIAERPVRATPVVTGVFRSEKDLRS